MKKQVTRVLIPLLLIASGWEVTRLIAPKVVAHASGIIISAYQTILNGGVAVTQRLKLNFINGGCVDNAGTASTDCTIGTSANFSQTFTNQTSVTIVHNLNTTAVITACYDNGSPPQFIDWNTLQITDANDVTVTFTNSQSGKCVVSGNLTSASSSGTVTSVAGGCQLSGGPITTAGTLSQAETVNSQTGTTYTFANGDCGKIVSQANGSAIADTLPQAGSGGNFLSGWYVDVENIGVGAVTITPTTSKIDGGTSLVLNTNQGARVVSNGTDYFTMRGASTDNTIINNVTINNSTINNSTTNNMKCNHCSLNGTELTNSYANQTPTGTTVNKLAKLTGAPSTAIISSAGDTSGSIGICASSCSTTGNAEIVVQGIVNCIYDNATTAGDYVTISASVAGDCHDAGGSYPVGTQVIGRVIVSGAAGSRSTSVFGAEFNEPAFARTVWYEVAGCNNATAASAMDLPTSGAAVPACVTGTNIQKGVLQYTSTAATITTGQFTFRAPQGTTGTVDFRVTWNTAGTSGNMKWFIGVACTATNASATDDPAFTDSTVVTAAPGTTLQIQTSTITGVTGCSAGNLVHIQAKRNTNDAADTLASTVNLIGVEVVIRVTPQS